MRALTWIVTVASIALSGVGAEASTDPATSPLRLQVRAREHAPGEPVRILVHASEPLGSVAARCLRQEVFLTRLPAASGASGAETWSGWAVIPLDAGPGPIEIEARGETAHERPVEARLTVRVKEKEFPVQRLRVERRYVEPPDEELARIERERETLASVYARRTPSPPPAGPFLRPVPGKFLSPYGAKRIFNDKPRAPHPGLDLRAPAGTPVRASGPGRVALAADLYFSGKTLILDHGAGLFTIYAHLSELRAREGEDVEAGQVVGLSGATGRVTGPHLHWGAKIGDLPFDPSALLDRSLFEG